MIQTERERDVNGTANYQARTMVIKVSSLTKIKLT